MSSASHADGPEEDRRRRAAADTLPVMGSVEVVELHEATQAVTQGRPTGEVVAAEDDPPVLAEDRLLQPLDEPVGPGMPRLNAGLANPKLGTDRGELRLTGTASAAAPFSIVSGSLFTLAGLGATQNVTCASARQPPRSRERMLVSPQTATLS
jgi:hypothetical protein